MTNSIKNYKIEGLDKLQENLKRINKNLQAKAQFQALGAGANALKKTIRKEAPVRNPAIVSKTKKGRNRKSGKLKRSINYKIFEGFSSFSFGPTGAYGFVTSKDRVAHLVEFGHLTKLGKGKAKPRGRVRFVPPNAFFRRGIDAGREDFLNAVEEELKKFFNDV